MPTNTFTTLNAAKTLRQRHPDAPPSVVLVGLVLATFADGKTGTSIRPGFDRVVAITGLSISSVQRGVRWLEERGELRRDKEGRRGSAAHFTWVGGIGRIDGTGSPPDRLLKENSRSPRPAIDAIAGQPEVNSRSPVTPHLPNQPEDLAPPALQGPPGRPDSYFMDRETEVDPGSPEEEITTPEAPRCSVHTDEYLVWGWCARCAWENDPDNPETTRLRRAIA